MGRDSAASVDLNGTDEASVRLEALHAEHGRAVLGLCRTLLRNPTDAEDAHQATFLAAFCSLTKGTVPHEPGAWLTAIARNECWARVRARMREPLLAAEPDEAVDSADPLSFLIRNEDVGAFWAAFAGLPKPQQRAFLLREFRGLSYEDLALALGVSDSAVESLLFRARRGLRTAMATVAAFPLGVRELVAQLGEGTANSSVAAKAATATVGLSLFAAGTAGLEAHHPVAQSVTTRAAPAHSHHARARVASPVATPVATVRPRAHVVAHRVSVVWVAGEPATRAKIRSEDTPARASHVEDATPAQTTEPPERSSRQAQPAEAETPVQAVTPAPPSQGDDAASETEHPDATSPSEHGDGSGDSHQGD